MPFGNRDKLRPDGPVGSYANLHECCACSSFCKVYHLLNDGKIDS